MCVRHAIMTGSLCALLATGALGDSLPLQARRIPRLHPVALTSERIEVLPADDRTVIRRMAAVCETALGATVTYATRGFALQERTGGFVFAQSWSYEYLLIGVPSEVSLTAVPGIALDGGAQVEFIERLAQTLVLGRVPAGTAPILRDVVASEYANSMAIPRRRLMRCIELGQHLQGDQELTIEQEILAADCERNMEYRGPELGFTCPVIAGENTWSFLRMLLADYPRYPAFGDDAVAPMQYRGYALSGTGGDRSTQYLGLPVFAPDQDKNYVFGVIAAMEHAGGATWEFTILPNEALIFQASVAMRKAENQDKALKNPGDSPTQAAP